MSKHNDSIVPVLALAGLGMSAYATLFSFLIWLGAWLFQFNLWCIVGKDVPWYLDICGAFVINGINVPLAIGCAIARACGIETPFWEI